MLSWSRLIPSHRHPGGGKNVYTGVLLALLCFTGVVHAEEMLVPAEVQVPLLLKILTFDRNFDVKISPALTMGIVYVPEDPASLQAKDDIVHILDTFATKTIKKLPITYVPLEYTTDHGLAELAKARNINVFYLVTGNAPRLQALLEVSRAQQILTVTGIPDYVARGVAIGIGLNRESKPLILINLPASKSTGSAFDANLLKLATVVQ